MAAAVAFSSGGCGGGEEAPLGGECEAGGRASSDRFLPFDVGNVWRYRVTDVATGEVTTKRQELTEGDGTVIVQLTTKANGSTENVLTLEGDAQVRLQQIDYDSAGVLERTTDYMPSKLRLDESAEATSEGASFTETYSQVVTDAVGTETTTSITEQWTVLGVDVPCSSAFGELSCLHLRRMRTVGGVSDKEFFYARGIGKVLETGGQTEELLGCTLN
jgi:hypothetical protein